MEVLSPSTARLDSYLKLAKYVEAGVRECWVVDPVHKRVYVHDWENNDIVIDMYTFHDEIPVRIFKNECKVKFQEIYEYVEFLYQV